MRSLHKVTARCFIAWELRIFLVFSYRGIPCRTIASLANADEQLSASNWHRNQGYLFLATYN